jgi:CheY-like chemotaxis protein
MAVIVHIEDDDVVAHIIDRVLSRDSHHILRARTAREGIDLTRQYQPDLVIIDMWLPEGLDGWAAAQIMKEDPELTHIPLLAVTAQGNETSRQRALAIGFTGFISKPFEIDRLRQTIRAMLLDTN